MSLMDCRKDSTYRGSRRVAGRHAVACVVWPRREILYSASAALQLILFVP